MEEIKAELSNSSMGDMVCRLYVPNYIFIVPPHTAESAFGPVYTNEKQLKRVIKKLLLRAVENLEVEDKTND